MGGGGSGGGRFLNLSYGGPTRPTDLAKVTSFLITYRDLAIKVGDPMDLGAFLEKRSGQSDEVAARKLRRAILLFLTREERAVQGPVLRPRHRVQEVVLRDRRVETAIALRSESGVTPEAARAQAEKIFREIAANMNSTFLAALGLAASAVVGEIAGPEDVAPAAVFLASDASRYMTGATLVIDGGYTLW